jgi:hypothetical protein
MRRYNFHSRQHAVSEIVGGIILLLIAVSSFSVIYLFVFPLPTPETDVHVKLIGYVDSQGNATLKHVGGECILSYKIEVRNASTNDLYYSHQYEQPWKIGEIIRPPLQTPLHDAKDKVHIIVYTTDTTGGYQEVFNGILTGNTHEIQVGGLGEIPMLISSLLTNTADEDLICFNYTLQPSINALTYIYNWSIDDVPLTRMLLPFDTNDPLVAKDYSGYHHDGMVHGASWQADGVVGGAFAFDGASNLSLDYCFSDSYVDSLTIELWMKTGESFGTLLSYGRESYCELGVIKGYLCWSTTAGDGTVDTMGSIRVDDDLWHYVAVSYDASTGQSAIYADGALDISENAHAPGGSLGSGTSCSGFLGRGTEVPSWETLLSTSFETQDEVDMWTLDDERTTATGHHNFNRRDSSALAPHSGSYSLVGWGDFDPNYVAFNRETIDVSVYTNVSVSLWYSYDSTETEDAFGCYYADEAGWIPIFEELAPNIGNGNQLWPYVYAETEIPDYLYDLVIQFWWSTSSYYEYMAIDDLTVTAFPGFGRNFTGFLDEIHVYDRALSGEQIYQNYLCTKDGDTSQSVIVSEETIIGETWMCTVTPNDGMQDDEPEVSNTLTIVSYGGG